MANVGGLPGGMIQPNAQGSGGIRPPVGESGTARPGAPSQGIANGTTVEGLVAGKEGEIYQVRVGAQTLNARSTIPLFVGQRFRAVWDTSTAPPMLRLQQADVAVLARFSGRDRDVAFALLSRGLPLKEDVLLALRQHWMQSGGDPAKLGVLAELWARGAQMTEANVVLLAWYMELSPERAMQIWKRIRERLHARKFGSPQELLEALRGGGDADDEVARFLRAHALAGRPAREGLDPSMLLAPAWWPVDDREGRMSMARVAFSGETRNGRRVWWTTFELEGDFLGPVVGDVMTNGRALSVNIRLHNADKVSVVDRALPALRDELEALALPLQHLGAGVWQREERDEALRSGVDMEA